MLNMFVPAKVLAPEPVRGLAFGEAGELQKDFVVRFRSAKGTFLVGSGPGHCLCGFDDWDALYSVARTVMGQAAIGWLALIHFWSGDRYELVEREVDPGELEACTAIEVGEVVILRAQPEEQRRHRRVVRALQERVGSYVTLTFKSGRALHGELRHFDAESEVGRLDLTTFVAGQIFSVTPRA
ncbi:MAG: hypothetical protein HY898_35010 [Deltaproteobacteria bacterium]|nr:hypothetical protein [Deltaproteobacteria bacterium]